MYKKERENLDKMPMKVKPRKRAYKVINVADALKLRIVNHYTYKMIADRYDVSKQAVHDALKKFEIFINNPEIITAYREHKTNLLDVVEMELLSDIADPAKREKASLNNTAYAFQNIHNANRLEKGQSTANTNYIEINKEIKQLEIEIKEYEDTISVNEAVEFPPTDNEAVGSNLQFVDIIEKSKENVDKVEAVNIDNVNVCDE